jgi:hypothetical protein
VGRALHTLFDNFHDTAKQLNQSIVAAKYMNPDGSGT